MLNCDYLHDVHRLLEAGGLTRAELDAMICGATETENMLAAWWLRAFRGEWFA